MGNGTPNRFEWLKAVNRSNLLHRAKVVASALALEFFNEATGQLNPGIAKLAEASGSSNDTVKRGVRDLIEAGWLGRTEGRGRGNKTVYSLLSPGKIIAISRPKKGAAVHHEKGGSTAPSSKKKGARVHGKGGSGALSSKKKGARVHGKGGSGALSYIEQSSEQKTSALTLFANHRFLGSATDGPITIKADRWEVLNPWAEWLSMNALPKLCELNIGGSDKSGKFYFLPFKSPPSEDAKAEEAKWYFNEMLSHREVIHAAQ